MLCRAAFPSFLVIGSMVMGGCRELRPISESIAEELLAPLSDHDGAAETPVAETTPPAPEAQLDLDDGAAWIQLTSGEWLRGSLMRLRRGSLTFKSDQVGEQAFGLSSVQRIVGAGHSVVLTEDGRTFEGSIDVDESNLWVRGDQTFRIPRSEVLSVLRVREVGRTNWSGRISLGATFRSGNTDQADYTALTQLLRETARTRWSSRYVGAISSVNEEETANNHRLNSRFDVYLTQRAFLTAPGLEIYRDRFQNIALRVTPSVAIGYQLLDGDRHRCSISLGPAVRYQRQITAPPSGDAEETTAAGVFSTEYGWDVSSAVDLSLGYEVTAPVPDVEEFNHHLLLNLAVDLPGDLDLDIAFIWDRVNEPALNNDGVRPQPDDFRTTIGLGWSF
ncbi:MAG: DUF481 domain-containing protein [Planctomycetota bacterium]